MEELKKVNQKEMPDVSTDDIDMIMYRIKCKIMKERIRVIEFMKDYDKLRTGRMLKTSFPRALDLCTFCLAKSEVQKLIDR